MEKAKKQTKKGLDEIKNFYTGDFIEIIIQCFKKPTDGLYSIFKTPSKKSLIHSLIIAVSVFILYLIGSYIVVGNGRKFLAFMDFVKMGLFPLMSMFLMAVLSFVIKSILGKADFKNELLTGAIGGIPFTIIILVSVIVQIFTKNNPLAIVNNPTLIGIIGTIIIFYALLMLINIFQQSLKSANVKDALAWYLSPVSIIASIYLSYQILY